MKKEENMTIIDNNRRDDDDDDGSSIDRIKTNHYYFSSHFKILRIFGLWSWNDDSLNRDKKSSKFTKNLYLVYRITFLFTFAYLFTILELIELVLTRNDFEDLISNLCYAIVHVMACSKITLIIAKADDIRRITRSFGSGIFLPCDHAARNVINDCLNRTEKLLRIYFFIGTSVVTNGLLCPLYVSSDYTEHNGEVEVEGGGGGGGGREEEGNNVTIAEISIDLKKLRKLPYVSYFPFNVSETPNYELAYIYQGISLMTLSPIIITIDVLYGSILLHIATQLKILGINLTNIKPSFIDQKNIDKNFTNIEILNGHQFSQDYNKDFRNLKLCILHHQAIIGITEEIEEMFNVLVLLQFLSNLVIMCFPLFQITSVPVMSFPFFSMVSLMAAMMYQLFIFCNCGDEVNQQSLLVANSAYFVDWYKNSSGFDMRHAILTIVQRSQKPLRLTAAKFAVLSRETFLKVVQGSVSYFMFLRKMRNK